MLAKLYFYYYHYYYDYYYLHCYHVTVKICQVHLLRSLELPWTQFQSLLRPGTTKVSFANFHESLSPCVLVLNPHLARIRPNSGRHHLTGTSGKVRQVT